MSWWLRRAAPTAMMTLTAALLTGGCAEGLPANEPAPTEAATSAPVATSAPPASATDPRYPDPGERQAMSDDAYVKALNEVVPWTGEISPEILIYAARANCVVQVETGSYFQALEEADEQGFHGQDGVAFVQVAADAYCPSMRPLAGAAVTPTPEPTPEQDPADFSPTLTIETTGYQDGTWEVEFEFDEVPGAISYEFHHRGTIDGYEGRLSDWSSDVIDTPGSSPSEGGGIISGAYFEHQPDTTSAQHRVRAWFDDGTVGTWSNIVSARNPHR